MAMLGRSYRRGLLLDFQVFFAAMKWTAAALECVTERGNPSGGAFFTELGKKSRSLHFHGVLDTSGHNFRVFSRKGVFRAPLDVAFQELSSDVPWAEIRKMVQFLWASKGNDSPCATYYV